MTDIVSITELRSNISTYLGRAVRGGRVLIRDEKRQQTIAQITPVHSFDKLVYERAVKKAVGVFSAQAHPEWRTRTGVVRWLQKSRVDDERTF